MVGNGKRVLALLFILVMALAWVGSSPYTEAGRIYGFLEQQLIGKDPDIDSQTENPITMDNIESEFADSFWQKQSFINLNGAMAKRLGMQGFYSSMGMYITDDQYIVSASEWTATDYEYEEITALKDYLDERGIH